MAADSIDATLEALGLETAVWGSTWERSWPVGEMSFLEPDEVREAAGWLNLPDGAIEGLVRGARAIQECGELRRLLWHLHWLLYRSGEDHAREAAAWPMLPESLGEAGRLFYGVLCLSGLPIVRRIHAQRGIDESVTHQTLEDFPRWMEEYRRVHGAWGFGEIIWLALHFTGQVYSLGRLQFEVAQFARDFHLLQRTGDGQVLLLAGQGMKFRRDGQFDGTNGIVDPQAWTAEYREAGGTLRGNAIARDGAARPDRVEVRAAEWEKRVERGTPILNVHIPATGAMRPEECDESFRRAMQFFPRHFPEHRFVAFGCESWFLDAQLSQYLPAESNLVRFQRRFHLYPLPGADDRETIRRVFGGRPTDGETSLQRAVREHIRRGGQWRSAGGLFLRPG